MMAFVVTCVIGYYEVKDAKQLTRSEVEFLHEIPNSNQIDSQNSIGIQGIVKVMVFYICTLELLNE